MLSDFKKAQAIALGRAQVWCSKKDRKQKLIDAGMDLSIYTPFFKEGIELAKKDQVEKRAKELEPWLREARSFYKGEEVTEKIIYDFALQLSQEHEEFEEEERICKEREELAQKLYDETCEALDRCESAVIDLLQSFVVDTINFDKNRVRLLSHIGDYGYSRYLTIGGCGIEPVKIRISDHFAPFGGGISTTTGERHTPPDVNIVLDGELNADLKLLEEYLAKIVSD